MKTKSILTGIVILIGIIAAFGFKNVKKPAPMIKEENITYTAGGVTLKGFVAYDQNVKGKRPGILVVHEWWGLNNYVKMRAKKLAELGYIAMAVDMFGDGKNAANPKEAQEMTMPLYKDPQLAKSRLDAALTRLKEFPETDSHKLAAIGYCFGGAMVLNYAKLGGPVNGVVSFHGGLAGVPANKNLLKAKILVCYGANDKFVPMHDLDAFKHQMDSIRANYVVKIYANATHAFTNPDATKIGKEFNLPIEYNAAADKDSWNDMKVFFASLFKK
jgi:dienelactone hydrolase